MCSWLINDSTAVAHSSSAGQHWDAPPLLRFLNALCCSPLPKPANPFASITSTTGRVADPHASESFVNAWKLTLNHCHS